MGFTLEFGNRITRELLCLILALSSCSWFPFICKGKASKDEHLFKGYAFIISFLSFCKISGVKSADVFKYGPYCKAHEHSGKRWALLMKPFTLTQVWVKIFCLCLIFLQVSRSSREPARASQTAETKIWTLSLSDSLGKGGTENIYLCVSSLQLNVDVFMTFSSSFLMAAASSDSHSVRKEAALWSLLTANLMMCSSAVQHRLSIIVKGKEYPKGKLEEFDSGSGILPARRLIFSDGFHEDKWTKISKYILPVWQNIYQ